MAVAELPLPPFPYEKDFFGSPFPKGGNKAQKKAKNGDCLVIGTPFRSYIHCADV